MDKEDFEYTKKSLLKKYPNDNDILRFIKNADEVEDLLLSLLAQRDFYKNQLVYQANQKDFDNEIEYFENYDEL